MTKEELKTTINLLSKKRVEDLNEKAKDLLNLVQRATEFEICLTHFINYDYVEFNFVLKEQDNFGLDFRVSYNDYRGLELTHPLGGYACGNKALKPYIKERDKIIAKLWDKEEEIIEFFKELKVQYDKATTTITELGWKLSNVINEEKLQDFNEAMAQVKVGRKFKFSWQKGTWHENTTWLITKITDKLIFTDNYSYKRNKKSDFANLINNGSVFWVEESEAK